MFFTLKELMKSMCTDGRIRVLFQLPSLSCHSLFGCWWRWWCLFVYLFVLQVTPVDLKGTAWNHTVFSAWNFFLIQNFVCYHCVLPFPKWEKLNISSRVIFGTFYFKYHVQSLWVNKKLPSLGFLDLQLLKFKVLGQWLNPTEASFTEEKVMALSLESCADVSGSVNEEEMLGKGWAVGI